MLEMPYDKKSKRVETRELILALAPPVIAILLFTYGVVVATTPDMLSIWAAAPLGFAVGSLAMAVFIKDFGNSVMEIQMASVVVIIIALSLLPVAHRAKSKRLHKKGPVPAQMHIQIPASREMGKQLEAN